MNSLARPGNDAFATIAGFVFQVNVTIQHWLKLGVGEYLELEAGEDIDLVRQEPDDPDAYEEWLAIQLKQLSGTSLTLRNPKALEAVANFCGHRKAYPEWNIKFRFMTTLVVGREQAWDQTSTAILTWEDIRQNNVDPDKIVSAVEAIRRFLKDCTCPPRYSARSWARLEDVLHSSDPNELLEIIRRFEWVTGAGDHRKVKEEVIETLRRLVPGQSVEAAERAFEHLFASVFGRLCLPGQKLLTSDNLATTLAGTCAVEDDLIAARRLLGRLDILEGRMDAAEATLQEQSGIIQAVVTGMAEESARTRKTFLSHAEFFWAFEKRKALYDFEQQLQGRRKVQVELNQFLDDETKRIAVLPGRGGIGKTKLLRDWSQKQDAWTSLWTAPRIAVWTAKSESEIPNQSTILVIDDAHRYDFLEQVMDIVARQPDSRRLKLIISIRPSGNDYLKRTLATMMDASIVQHFEPLKPLKAEDVLAMAEEALGAEHIRYSQQLAIVSHDAPIITVAGGRLIAREEILPALLNNHQQFRSVVMDHLASQYEGEILTKGVLKREFMEVVAALQPVAENEGSFYAGVLDYLGLHESQARRSFGTLEDGGVLVRSGGKVSIVPDMLADHILEQAAVESDGTSTRFADEIFRTFQKSHLTNLLKNLSELDWRISVRDNGSLLLDDIWATILSQFRQQDAADRTHFLRVLEPIARYQPQRVQAIAQLAMDEAATPAWRYGLHYYTQKDVLKRLPDFLGVTIFHPSVSRDAFYLLWKLAHNEDTDISRSAEHTMERVVGYHKYRDVDFLNRMLGLVEELAHDTAAYRHTFTPLDLIDPLFAREVDDHDWVGRAFHVGVLLLNHGYVKDIREKALAMLNVALYAREPVVAVRATRSLGKVIGEFRPKMRDVPTSGEQLWQNEERMRALKLLEHRIDAGEISVQQVWKIHRILRSVEGSERQSQEVKVRARTINAKLAYPEQFWLLNLLCTEEWEDRAPDENFSLLPKHRNVLEQAAWSEFQKVWPEPRERVQQLEDLLQLANDSKIAIKSLERTVAEQCKHEDFLTCLSERLLAGELPLLESAAAVALSSWRERDRKSFLHFGLAFAAAPRERLALAAVLVIPSEFTNRRAMPDEIEILSVLTKRKEPFLVLNLFHGVGALARQPQFIDVAEAMIRGMEIGTHPGVANAYCGIVGPGPFSVGSDVLSIPAIEEMLRKLIPVTELDQHHVASFISYVCGRVPLGVIGLLKERLEYASKLSTDEERSSYEAVPSPRHWSSLSSVRESPDYAESLRSLLDILRIHSGSSVYLEEFFWRMAAGDDTTLRVFSERLAAGDDRDASVVLHLLHEGPTKSVFTSPQFAEQILQRFAAVSPEAEQNAIDALVSNAVRLGGGGFAGGHGPIEFNRGLAERAQAELLNCAQDSRLAKVYAILSGVQPVVFPGFEQELLDDESD